MPADLTLGQFVYVVRKRINLSPEKAIFIFVKNILPPTGEMKVNSFYFSDGLRRNFLDNPFMIKNFGFVFAAALMSAIDEDNKDEDGFLYMTYSGENTFGQLWNMTKLFVCVNMGRKREEKTKCGV